MKTNRLKSISLFSILSLAIYSDVQAQTTADFENLTLTTDSYFDGSTDPDGTTFTSGNAIFPNVYNSGWFYWESGWAYSNMKDSTTAGYTNMFSARAAIGNNGSANYIVGQKGAVLNLNPTAIGKVVSGLHVTNSTYAALSMRDGDTFGKKFGGVSGNDPDWFKLAISNWSGGTVTDSIEFYLADFRFSDNSQDYILTEWEWIDLSSLGNSDSLTFTLSSSDVGTSGMNTPGFFCLDDVKTADSPMAINELNFDENSAQLFPNPATDRISIDLSELDFEKMNLRITDMTGKVIFNENITDKRLTKDISAFENGMYLFHFTSNNSTFIKKFQKN